MADRENVIGNFEHAVNKAIGEGWDFVDLFTEDGKKILELLKKQKPKHVIPCFGGVCCPSCTTETERLVGLKKLGKEMSFCPYCGQAVKWNG